MGAQKQCLLDSSCDFGRYILSHPDLSKVWGMQLKLPLAIWEGFGEEVTLKLLMGSPGKQAGHRIRELGFKYRSPHPHLLTTVPKANSLSLLEASS